MLCVGPPAVASGIPKLIDEVCSSLKEKSIPRSIGHATCLKVGSSKTTNRIRLSPNRGGLSALHHKSGQLEYVEHLLKFS
jgi:hypothetical protein